MNKGDDRRAYVRNRFPVAPSTLDVRRPLVIDIPVATPRRLTPAGRGAIWPAVGVSASGVGRLEQFAPRSADQQLAPQRHSALEAEILQLLGDEPRRAFVGFLRDAVVADEADPQDLVVTAAEHVPRFEAVHGLEPVGEAVVDPVHEFADRSTL